MRSIATFDLQYAHRFYGFRGEAQYLHRHTGVLTIEVEDTINTGVNMVYPCNEIQKIAWNVLKNFDHALVLREDDPLLPAVLGVYEKQGIKNGNPQNTMKGAYCKSNVVILLISILVIGYCFHCSKSYEYCDNKLLYQTLSNRKNQILSAFYSSAFRN